MYPHLTDQVVSQHQTDIATQARQSHRPSQVHQRHEHPIRRRAGYALVSLGLRLAYTAGQD
jgi:hypothetical protein